MNYEFSAAGACCLIMILFISLAAGPAAAKENLAPAELAAKVQTRYKQIDSLKADYQRTSRFQAAGGQAPRKVEGKGKLTWARPVKLRLVQMEPRKELIITTDDGVWWTRPQRKRADLYPLDQFTSGLGPMMDALGGLSRLGDTFRLKAPSSEEAGLGGGGPVLVLEPLKTRADLKRLVLWFDANDLVLAGFRIISLVGDVTDYRLSNVKANPPMQPGLFSFTPAPDFRVRDHRPNGGPKTAAE